MADKKKPLLEGRPSLEALAIPQGEVFWFV